MIFGNPVRQAYIRPPGSKALAGSFRVTQDFGPTSVIAEPSFSWGGGEGIPAGYYRHFHKGLDLGNLRCGDAVVAAQSGTISAAGKTSDGAIRVIINHGSGWESWYWHLSNEIVSVGQRVVKGQVIGHLGSTGNSSGCHLHFVIRKDKKYLDPWTRLAQNVWMSLKSSGINIRADAQMGAIFASSKDDGLIHRKSDDMSLGAFSAKRKWGGTVTGAAYTLNGEIGKTWEKIDLDGGWRYVATPLVTLSMT